MSIPDPPARRRARAVLRYVLGLAVGALVLLLLLGKRGDLAAAARQLGHLNSAWLAAAVVAEAMSLWAFAYLQHQVLRLAGAIIPMPALMVLSLANVAIANTVPGEPVVSSAYRYRYYRRYGASGAAAGWTVFTVLIAQAIGMSVLLLVGVVVALAGATSAADAGVTVVGLAIVAAAIAVLMRRDVLLRLVGGLVRTVRRGTGHPRGSLGARIDATLARMREIPLSTRSTVGLVAIGTGVWFCDFLCLVCAFGAVQARIPWYGVLLAYGAAQVVGSLPVVPGGLGIFEGSLAVILAAYGAGRVSAVSVALAFRLVNYWLASAVGWAGFGVLAYYTRRRFPVRDGSSAAVPPRETPGRSDPGDLTADGSRPPSLAWLSHTARRILPLLRARVDALGETRATDDRFEQLERNLAAIAARLRDRAPACRVLVVDYLSILPADGPAPQAPPPTEITTWGRAIAARLAAATQAAARTAGWTYVPASAASADHHAWSAAPWTRRFHLSLRGGAPYHPNAAGMAAIADLVLAALAEDR